MNPPAAVLAVLAALILSSGSPGAARFAAPRLQPPPDVATPPADALTTPSGVAMKVLQPGTGSGRPADNDCVTVRFTAWTRDGTLYGRSQSAGDGEMQCLNAMAVGVADALKLMPPGEKRRLWVPAALTVGRQPRRSRGHGSPRRASAEAAEQAKAHEPAERGERQPGSADLTYDVELIGIIKAPPTPVDLNAPPANPLKTSSGLSYRVLRTGEGTEHPLATSEVLLHFSGWTPDGRLFVSTVMAGHPALFRVVTLPTGWHEGIRHMTAGEKARFWVPATLALGGKPPSTSGADTFVYDVELIAIQ